MLGVDWGCIYPFGCKIGIKEIGSNCPGKLSHMMLTEHQGFKVYTGFQGCVVKIDKGWGRD